MPSADVDEYEKTYMAPDEQVLFREKVVSRGAFKVSIAFLVVFGLAGLALLAAGAAGAVPAATGFGVGGLAAAFAAFMGITGPLFSVFRVMVTTAHVHVHFGWSKRRIPFSAISAIRAVELTGLRQGKVSVGLDGIVRTWVGRAGSGRGVEITYEAEGGRKHVLTIGSDEPEAFVAAVERARAAPTRIDTTAATRVADAEDEIGGEAESNARRSAE
jgi:hypothetical protein